MKLDQKPFLTVFCTAEVNHSIKGKQEFSKTKGNYTYLHKQIYLAIWLTYSHRFWKCLPHKSKLFFHLPLVTIENTVDIFTEILIDFLSSDNAVLFCIYFCKHLSTH